MTNLPVVDFERGVTLNREEIREFMNNVKRVMLAKSDKIEGKDVPLKHYFSEGVYGREMPMFKGMLVLGKIHKFRTMNVLSKGEVTVLSVDGPMRLKAPATFVSSPGAQRLIYAHEDSVWTCFIGTHETDIEKIEEKFVTEDYAELDAAAGIIEIQGGK